jgi:alkanesulfonate monooxygenase
MMKLGAFLPAPGHHVAAWRHPHARPDGGLDFDYYRGLVQTAERGLFDMVFLSDGAGVRTKYRDADELSRQGRMVHFEPLTLLSALAVHATRIGLTATASTTYNEPFNVARMFASLDHLSAGRSGWNVVTSATAGPGRVNPRPGAGCPPRRVRRVRAGRRGCAGYCAFHVCVTRPACALEAARQADT